MIVKVDREHSDVGHETKTGSPSSLCLECLRPRAPRRPAWHADAFEHMRGHRAVERAGSCLDTLAREDGVVLVPTRTRARVAGAADAADTVESVADARHTCRWGCVQPRHGHGQVVRVADGAVAFRTAPGPTPRRGADGERPWVDMRCTGLAGSVRVILLGRDDACI
mgnify:FL=1